MAKVRVAVLLLGIFWLFWSAGELRAEEIHPRIDSLYKLLDQESNESRQAELHFQIGQAYDQLSIESSEKGYKLKLDHFRKAQQYARPNRKPEYAIESLMEWMQWAREKENKLPSWEEYNQEIQPYLKTKAFGIYEADYLKELVLKARWQKQQGSEKKALDSYRDLIVKSNQDTLLNRYATLAFDWYKENNQLEVLTKWFKDRQTRLEKKQNLSGLQALHFGRAEIYNRLEDGPPAIEQWEKAAFYAGKLNRRLDQSAAWLRIGNYYRIDQAFPEAINYFKKSLVILDSLGKANFRSGNKPHLQRFIDVSVVLINLSSTAFAAEDYTSSAKYAEQAYQTANKWGLIHNKVLAACQWSAANCARGRESEQLLLLLKLLADDSLQFVADETKDRFLLQASLAEAFYLLRDYSEAIRYLNRNVTLHQTKLPNASWKAMDRTYELIYLCQKASGQQLLAFQSLQRLISMRDSVHEIEIKSNEEALLSRSLIEKRNPKSKN